MRAAPTPGVAELVRETADGLADLVGQHLKLARIELAAGLQLLGRRGLAVALFAALIVVGYTLGIVGLAAFLGGFSTAGRWLLAISLVHVGVGAVGMSRAVARLRGTALMEMTAGQMSHSLATLGSAATTDVR